MARTSLVGGSLLLIAIASACGDDDSDQGGGGRGAGGNPHPGAGTSSGGEDPVADGGALGGTANAGTGQSAGGPGASANGGSESGGASGDPGGARSPGGALGEGAARADGGTHAGGREQGGAGGLDRGEGASGGLEAGASNGAGAGGSGGEAGASSDCAPVVLARDSWSHFTSLTVADGSVYATSYGTCPISRPQEAQGTIVRVARAGGPSTVLTDRVPCPKSITVSGDDVYWTNAPQLMPASVMTMPKAGGARREIDLDETSGYPLSIRADSDSVYWAELDGVRRDGIYKTNRDLSMPPERLETIFSGEWRMARAFVLDDQYVYWSDKSISRASTILRAPKSGSDDPIVIATGTSSQELGISSAGLFWLDLVNTTFTVRLLEWSAEEPSTLATASNVLAMAVRDDVIYWAAGNIDSATIYRLRIGSSLPDIIAAGMRSLVAIELDDRYIYWLDGDATGGGRVVRACR